MTLLLPPVCLTAAAGGLLFEVLTRPKVVTGQAAIDLIRIRVTRIESQRPWVSDMIRQWHAWVGVVSLAKHRVRSGQAGLDEERWLTASSILADQKAVYASLAC